MNEIRVNFNNTVGAVKPMHAVNNGPIYKFAVDQRITNIEPWREAGIPYARTHDASFCSTYGGEHTVDVNNIFTNFDADPYDPASYDFVLTDEYMRVIEHGGSEPFFRLGSKIEHWQKKYNTLPPKDFKKWAVVCEHIIRHCNEGWANGHHRNIEYWEIWNEPDLDPDDSTHKRCWGGTAKEFYELFEITLTHLKIGGPAICGKLDWAEAFLAQLKAPLDFFSWHIYAHDVEKITDKVQRVRALLDKYGYEKTESILNEWNYVLEWKGDALIYSHQVKTTAKGAAFTLGTMCACQNLGILDLLMYYDARPSTPWCGIFNFRKIGKPVTTAYYTFPIFNTLYRLGESVVPTGTEKHVYATAAKNAEATEAAVAFTHFDDDDAAGSRSVSVDLSGFSSENGVELEIYRLDDDHALTKEETVTYFGDRFVYKKEIPNFTSYLLKMRKL